MVVAVVGRRGIRRGIGVEVASSEERTDSSKVRRRRKRR